VCPHLKKDGYGARNNAGGIEGEERQKREEKARRKRKTNGKKEGISEAGKRSK